MPHDVWFSVGQQIGQVLVNVAGGAVAGAVVAIVIRIKTSVGKSIHDIRRDQNKDTRIHEQLAELKIQLPGAIRAYVSRYKNGEMFLDSSSFTRKTRTHEVVTDGVSHQYPLYENMPMSMVPDETKLVLDDGHSFTWVKDLPPGSRFHGMCVAGGVYAIVRCALKHNSQVVGFVGVDFNEVHEPPKNLHLVEHYTQRIQNLLEL